MSIKKEHKMLETPYTRDRVKGVLPAFVVRERLISRPHYVRLRIIAIHCDFSSESYIHIDPTSIVASIVLVSPGLDCPGVSLAEVCATCLRCHLW